MVLFFKDKNELIYAVDSAENLDSKNISKLEWLFVGKFLSKLSIIYDKYIGPKKTMITPWSTNAVEITQNMAISGVKRIETYILFSNQEKTFDPMLFELYSQLDQDMFKNTIKPEPLTEINDIKAYNEKEGLALNDDEINFISDRCDMRAIKCPKGSLVVWDSRLVHCGMGVLRDRKNPNFRCINYLSYMQTMQTRNRWLQLEPSDLGLY